jgi:uncharacterized protein YcbX
MRLHHPEEIALEPFGVASNRRFYLIDEHGDLINATDHGPLLAIDPDYDPATERLSLRFPDGEVIEGPAAALGEPVRTDFYGRPVNGNVLEGPWAAALSSYAGQPLRLARTARPGDGSDSATVSIASTASARELARVSGSERGLDSRRFRMLLEVDGCGAHEEDSWIGGRVRVGGAVVEVTRPVARCVITTLHPDTGRKDLDTLKVITGYRGLRDGRKIDFGVYGEVVEPGTVRVGDPVTPLPA